MVQLGILLSQNHRLLSVAAVFDVFESVNRFCHENGLPDQFRIQTIRTGDDGVIYNRFPELTLSDPQQFDLIIVPAFNSGNVPIYIQENGHVLSWLRQQHKQGAELASVCSGAFLLAATGLLNGKCATTHMDAISDFSAAFPEVNVQAEAVVTSDQGIYTSGGATSSFHLLIQLIEKYTDRDMAIRIAKFFAIDLDRNHQTYFGSFQPTQTHHDELVKKVQQRIKNDFAAITTIEELLRDIPTSRRNFVRRFKLVTGNTPIEYLQKTRIEAAKRYLEKTSGGILESMIESGYNDQKAFRLLFKKTVGITPSAYRSKYMSRV
ncbi:GlxA family transcriptional regulator [Pedobacter duraquae]|uniref:Transcriptional regulator GlxA family with amidase domain n=1 Tax=Pedobacter duraquae TaxID=425511 RepID=A0A4R6IKG5_9SPHI|nr:helix-turn-helix domain-containing protein [Pedobacter duraquae]TDO22552.1 transcriptional regulator GlxA family with amidase domain [Pedobacter duraquae]